MEENISQMRKRHKEEIDALQSNCKHLKISDWLPYMWAPGHMGSDVKVCEFCGKIVDTNNPSIEPVEFSKDGGKTWLKTVG